MNTLVPSLLAGAITVLMMTVAYLAIRDSINPKGTIR